MDTLHSKFHAVPSSCVTLLDTYHETKDVLSNHSVAGGASGLGRGARQPVEQARSLPACCQVAGLDDARRRLMQLH